MVAGRPLGRSAKSGDTPLDPDFVIAFIIVGLGNIGSHLVRRLARLNFVARIVLIDPDRYEDRNQASQYISAQDVGRLKVDVMAELIRSVNPRIQVEVIAAPVEQVPLTRLRADVIITGLDALGPRRWVNRAARRLGVLLIDIGVRVEALLVRVDVVAPLDAGPCLECGWTDSERASLDRVYACAAPQITAPTDAPRALGDRAARTAVEVLRKIKAGAAAEVLGRQILLVGEADQCYVTEHGRFPDCGFDHHCWSVQRLPYAADAITVRRALALCGTGSETQSRLRVADQAFVHRLFCSACHASHRLLFLAGRMSAAARVCAHCGGALVAPGMDVSDTLCPDRLTDTDGRKSLSDLGLRDGDVFSIETSAGEVHFEIGGP